MAEGKAISTFNDVFLVFILVSAAHASRALSISSAHFRSLALTIAESNRTLKLFSGGYSDCADNQDGRDTSKYEGTGKEERGRRGA